MIVYSDRRRSASPRELLGRLLQGLGSAAPDAASLLIQAGELEAGLLDAIWPEMDGGGSLLPSRMGKAMVDLALLARGDKGRLASARQRFARLAADLPTGRIEVSEPEGFAFYALYPETYAEAARRFLQTVRPESAVVVGVRSIGTTLSAVVAAELVAQGVRTSRITVRPRGHPWDRELRLSPGLEAVLAQAEQVLVVDEGPGISGTSFASVAEAASEAGVPDARIHLFPSWDAEGSGLRSERARAIWPRVRRWTVSFEEMILDTGRLAAAWGGGGLRDLSGGLWREVADPTGLHRDRWPAVQPQHERRKYLLEREDGTRLLLKFVGLGERGPRALARAEARAADGFAPPVVGLKDGFLAADWVEGCPPSRPDAEVLDAVGRYLGFLAAQPPVGTPRLDDILHMTRLNAVEGLGEEAAGLTGWMEEVRAAVESRPAIAGDGRMLPQEWLRTGRGVLKCDGIDHHDDHFWPGAQDLAWDLCGAAVEFGLDAAVRGRLVEDVVARTGDSGLPEVLPFYEAAYLAWRLGYTTLAAETLGTSEDGLRMARDRDRYAALLRTALERAR